jgi:predicted NUDIX family NTP pyrophosphohydrolase
MRKSAGILLFRKRCEQMEFFLVHPGGPFWKGKEKGAWSIPKGEFTDEEPLKAALREFEEETGIALKGDLKPLTPVKLKSGKIIYAWALEGDADAEKIRSNYFDLEWPPRSGKRISVPEVDKAGWFATDVAMELLNPYQAAFVQEAKEKSNKGIF